MKKWTQGNNERWIFDGERWIGDAQTGAQAEAMIAAHNADCDACDARIAGLERRLTKAEGDRHQLGERWQQLRDQMDAIMAIAEGRDDDSNQVCLRLHSMP